MNMAYCRFENTTADLNDCYHALREEREDMSKSEKYYAKRLYEISKKYIEYYEKVKDEIEN